MPPRTRRMYSGLPGQAIAEARRPREAGASVGIGLLNVAYWLYYTEFASFPADTDQAAATPNSLVEALTWLCVKVPAAQHDGGHENRPCRPLQPLDRASRLTG